MTKDNAKPMRCEGCPAYDWGEGFVTPENQGQPTKFALIGQGPGEGEARYGRPFHPSAPAGRTLSRWLSAAELGREEALITNIVWCWLPATRTNGLPKGNREPTQAEITHCRSRHLDPLLKEEGYHNESSFIVAVGAPATRSLTKGEGSMERYMGSMQRIPSSDLT